MTHFMPDDRAAVCMGPGSGPDLTGKCNDLSGRAECARTSSQPGRDVAGVGLGCS